MDEASSATDISSSLSEFVRKEKLLKELYQDKPRGAKPVEVERLKYNDEEIDGILQQMGRLLSPDGEDVDNSVYKHVMEETENKSIEQILNEAKELVKESTPICENISPCFSTDDLSSEYPENDITFINIKTTTHDDMDFNGNNFGESTDDDGIRSRLINNVNKLNNYPKNTNKANKGSLIPVKNFPDSKKKSLNILQNLIVSKKKKNKNEYSNEGEVEFLKKEVDRFNQQYLASKEECNNLKKELSSLQRKWQEREERLIEECKHLKQELSSVSLQKVKTLQSKLNTANEMINKLNENYRNATEEWTKREMKLIDECNHLKYQITNTPKAIAPDVERIQEQLKDAQEMNLKLKFDFDSCKDKCVALEHLCADLKKVIMDEQIAEKLYANDNIPATVKQFLSSSSSSVINTLSHVFGCLSKSSARNRHRDGSFRKELFTTNESLMINDLSRTFEHNEIIKELIKEKEQLKKENLDLNRQVKELEQIVRRRAHPNFSHVSDIIKSSESKQYEQESETIKNLKKELLDKQHVIMDLKNQLVDSKTKYDQNLLNLQGKVVNIQEESIKLKEELDKKKHVPVNHGPKCKRRGRTCDPPPPSVRNFRNELSAKEREIQVLHKQLDEIKKTNRKLAKERGQYVSYLSSKEQSADDIHFSRRLPSEVNSEINSPDKPTGDFICRKNSHVEFQNDCNDVDVVDVQNTKNIEDTAKLKSTNIDQNKNSIKCENKLSADSKDPNDYKSLSDKLINLEEKHQNLQQITCNLLTLFTKDGMENIQNKLPSDEKALDQREELHRFVSALKEFST